MADNPNPLDYLATLNRLEPGIAPVDYALSLASIAMSLKRIADCMERNELVTNANMNMVASAINNHSQRVIYVEKV